MGILSTVLEGKRVVAAACRLLGLDLWHVSAHALPQTAADLEDLMRRWERENLLSPRALLLEREDVEEGDQAAAESFNRVIGRLLVPLILSTSQRRRSGQRPRSGAGFRISPS